MLTLSLLYSPLHRLLSSHFQVSTVRKPGSTGKVVVNVNLPNDPYVTAGLAENNCVVRLDLSAEHDNIVIPCKVVVSFDSNNKLEVGDPGTGVDLTPFHTFNRRLISRSTSTVRSWAPSRSSHRTCTTHLTRMPRCVFRSPSSLYSSPSTMTDLPFYSLQNTLTRILGAQQLQLYQRSLDNSANCLSLLQALGGTCDGALPSSSLFLPRLSLSPRSYSVSVLLQAVIGRCRAGNDKWQQAGIHIRSAGLPQSLLGNAVGTGGRVREIGKAMGYLGNWILSIGVHKLDDVIQQEEVRL
jgi:hypothetical protein